MSLMFLKDKGKTKQLSTAKIGEKILTKDSSYDKIYNKYTDLDRERILLWEKKST